MENLSVLGKGVTVHMDRRMRNIREPPVLWSIPLTLLLIVLIIVAAEVLFPFMPLSIGHQTWMWVVSTLIATIIASLITETISLDRKRSILSMGVAAIVSSLIYKDISKFIQRSIMDVVQGSIPNPILGGITYTSFLVIVPGALTGIILGGILGAFPLPLIMKQRNESTNVPSESVGVHLTNYEKICNTCGHQVPFDSKFCPFCGIEVTSRQAPSERFCRYCGSRIYHMGKFCPECGREIVTMSKPQVYISQ